MRYGSGYVSVDIDIDDVLSSMNPSAIQDLVDDLYHYGYVPTKLQKSQSVSIYEGFYQEAVEKLSKNYYQLTASEEVAILEIAKRF
jgi:hypothetical protein